MERSFAVSILCALLIGIPARAAAPDAVERAIQKGKDYLYSQQKPNGSWEGADAPNPDSRPNYMTGGQFGGTTALAVYALLGSGEAHQDPRIVKGIEWLKKNPSEGIYALGVRCNVWLLLPQSAEVRQLMRREVDLLLKAMKTQGSARGHYDYVNSGPSGTYSHSRSQYAVLGVWAGAQTGIEIPPGYWQIVEQGWVGHQDESGGWTYQKKSETEYALTPGMTAAGVATLFITQEYLRANEGVACKGNLQNHPSIEKGLKWITDNFDRVATDEKYPRDYPLATLYAIERIGVASGYKYFNKIDWYQKGADWLLRKQEKSGAWSADYGDVVSTSFAMLFLSRGGAPVAMNKLDWSTQQNRAAAWNQRPRDAANVARWIGRQSERDLNWQVVNLDASLADFHDSPILYLAGSGEIKLRDQDREKLRKYVEQGGLIFANADCGNSSFASSFRKLGSLLFPAYEFRELGEQHVIYTNQQYPRQKWRTKPTVLALGNGVREFMILLPTADGGRVWQLQNTSSKEELWQLAANIVLYSVDKRGMRFRGQTNVVEKNNSIKADKKLAIARLQYEGNWNPEPAGWERLTHLMHNQNKVELQVRTLKLGTDALENVSIAHLTGTTKFKLTEKQSAALRAFLDNGGVLVIDAAGGSSSFAESAEAEIAALTGSPAKPLPDTHAIYTRGDTPLEIGYRDFARRSVGGIKNQGRLQCAEQKGKIAIIFSREDLSAGLTGAAVDGVHGYDPATATELTRRILLTLGNPQ